MQKFKSIDSLSRVGFLNYSVGIFSLLTVALVALSIHIVCEGISLYFTYNELRSAVLLKSSDLEVQELIDRMSTMRSSKVSDLVLSSVDLDQSDSLLLSASINSVLNDVIGRNYTRAKTDFISLEKTFRQPMLRALGGDRQAFSKIEAINQSLDQLIGKKEELSKIDAAEAAIEESLKSNQSQFGLVAVELAELLNLQVESPVEPTQKLPVYQSGVFAGLPRLQRLDDEIASLADLREALSRSGGSVKLTGPDVHIQFNAKISAMRQTTENINASHESSLHELNQLREQAASISTELRTHSNQTKIQLTRLIVSGLEPKIGLLAHDLYQILVGLSEKFEMLPHLPKLEIQPI